MPRLAYRATLPHPPDEVFAFVADAENNPRWHAHVDETRWLDDRETGLGRRGRQTGHLWGRDWTFMAEVVEWDPPRLVTFQVIEGYRVRTSIQVEPDAAGSRMTLTVTTPPNLGPLDPVVSRLMQRITATRESGDIRRLRAALASASAPAPVSAFGPTDQATNGGDRWAG
jgi:uncharacterized membrane protein